MGYAACFLRAGGEPVPAGIYPGELNELIRPIHQKLSGGKEELVIQYEPNTEADQLKRLSKRAARRTGSRRRRWSDRTGMT